MHKKSLLKFISVVTFITFPLVGCAKNDTEPLPRHQTLKAFDPHRKEFSCKYERDQVPNIDPEAEAWHQAALFTTRSDLWPDQKNWKAAEALWIKASAKKHWKAMMNLASLYERGAGEGAFRVQPNPYLSVEIAEHAMILGIPAGYDKMGDYHDRGLGGIRQNSSRAWAFWQMAADQGNVQALTHIGTATDATYDSPADGFWGNRAIALKMLECAAAQGYGDAGYELGLTLSGRESVTPTENIRALHFLHDGTKHGSSKAARFLFGAFDNGDALVERLIDEERSARYRVLIEALYRNPDLRLPNLDKILPLPPARLPAWDGTPESLIKAAQPSEP